MKNKIVRRVLTFLIMMSMFCSFSYINPTNTTTAGISNFTTSSSLLDTTYTTLDYTSPTYTFKSFHFDGTAKYFNSDTKASTIVNDAIVGVNKNFTIILSVKRLSSGATQVLFCRDNSTTAVRQFSIFFSSLNKLVVTFYTNSTNYIQYQSTATFTELREFNEFAIHYKGTLPATSRISVDRNAQPEPGTTTQTGTFTTINNTNINPVQIGGRSNAANYSNSYINHIAIFKTDLSTENITTVFNRRVPFDLRSNCTLNPNLVLYLSADLGSYFGINWTWNDMQGGGVFTSTGVVLADLYDDAPALKQVSIVWISGQSNANGRVDTSLLATRFKGSLSWLKVWTGTTMTNINSVTNNNQYIETAGGYGIEYYLGEKLNIQYQKTIYIFKVAQGGSYLDWAGTPDWAVPNANQPTGGMLWIRIRNEINALKEWELANNYTITKIKFIWMQGEADCQVLGYANNYQPNWTGWLTGSGTSAIITSKIIPKFYIQPYLYDCLLSSKQTNHTLVYKSTVNTAKSNVRATNTTYYRTINTDSALVNNVDSVHYNDSGLYTISDSTATKIIIDGY